MGSFCLDKLGEPWVLNFTARRPRLVSAVSHRRRSYRFSLCVCVQKGIHLRLERGTD